MQIVRDGKEEAEEDEDGESEQSESAASQQPQQLARSQTLALRPASNIFVARDWRELASFVNPDTATHFRYQGWVAPGDKFCANGRFYALFENDDDVPNVYSGYWRVIFYRNYAEQGEPPQWTKVALKGPGGREIEVCVQFEDGEPYFTSGQEQRGITPYKPEPEKLEKGVIRELLEPIKVLTASLQGALAEVAKRDGIVTAHLESRDKEIKKLRASKRKLRRRYFKHLSNSGGITDSIGRLIEAHPDQFFSTLQNLGNRPRLGPFGLPEGAVPSEPRNGEAKARATEQKPPAKADSETAPKKEQPKSTE